VRCGNDIQILVAEPLNLPFDLSGALMHRFREPIRNGVPRSSARWKSFFVPLLLKPNNICN
jgi:hypothetical protein